MKDFLLAVVYWGSLSGMLVSLFMMLRSNWVARVRLEILRADSDRAQALIKQHRWEEIELANYFPTFDRLPAFEVMMRRWWIWDVNKFLAGTDAGGSVENKNPRATKPGD